MKKIKKEMRKRFWLVAAAFFAGAFAAFAMGVLSYLYFVPPVLERQGTVEEVSYLPGSREYFTTANGETASYYVTGRFFVTVNGKEYAGRWFDEGYWENDLFDDDDQLQLWGRDKQIEKGDYVKFNYIGKLNVVSDENRILNLWVNNEDVYFSFYDPPVRAGILFAGLFGIIGIFLVYFCVNHFRIAPKNARYAAEETNLSQLSVTGGKQDV